MPEWTQQETEILKKSWSDGYSATQISRILCEAGFKIRSRNAIIGRASRMDLKKRCIISRAKSAHSRCRAKKPGREATNVPTPLPREVIKTKHKIQNEPAPESAKTLMGLGPCQCKHPYGQGDYKFCGQPTDGGSYCDKHRTQNLRGGK